MSPIPDLPPLNRRNLVISSAVGALAGTAWGMSFVNASGSARQPEITVLRSRMGAILVIEFDKARILVVDGQFDNPISELVERSTGFLRRRLDILVASNHALTSLPSDFIDTWRISSVFSLPGDNPGFAEPLAEHRVEIGDLSLTATPIIFGEWSLPQPPTSRSWFLEVSWRGTRCIYLSSAGLIHRIPHTSRGEATLVITNDQVADVAGFSNGYLLALPAEAIETSGEPGDTSHILRLFREDPRVFRLEQHAITVKGTSNLG